MVSSLAGETWPIPKTETPFMPLLTLVSLLISKQRQGGAGAVDHVHFIF